MPQISAASFSPSGTPFPFAEFCPTLSCLASGVHSRSFAFQVSIKWDSTLTCPIGNQQVQGVPDASAEGEPDCEDPADLALQADNGDSTSSVNLFAGNVGGKTVDACCVPVEEEEVGTDYRTSNALRIGGLYLGTICDDPEAALAEAPYANRLAKRPPCPDEKDHISQALGGIIQGFASGVTSVQSDEGMQAAGISMPEALEMEVLYQPFLTHESKGSASKGGQPSGTAKGDVPEGFVVILGAAPWVPAVGAVDRAGNVVATGQGTVAGIADITVTFTGTFVAGRLSGVYTMGSGGGFPGGRPVVYQIDATLDVWEAFWSGIAETLLGAAEGLAMLNIEAPFGGVDFSPPIFNAAGDLLVAQAGALFQTVDQEEFEPPEPMQEAFEGIETGLNQLADDVATSTLISRTAVEADVRRAATLFGEAADLREEMNELVTVAPTIELLESITDWREALTEAGVALQTLSGSLLGGPFATVSSASFIGPVAAAEQIVSGFGLGLGAAERSAATIPLPTTLGNRSILVTDSLGVERLAGLFFSSDGQFNFWIPAGTAEGPAVLTVFVGDQVIATGRVVIREIAPGIFTANASGQGVPAAFYLRFRGAEQTALELLFDPLAALGERVPLPIDFGGEDEQVFIAFFVTGTRGANAGVTATIDGEDVPATPIVESQQFVGVEQFNVGPIQRSLIGRGVVELAAEVDGVPFNIVQVNTGASVALASRD